MYITVHKRSRQMGQHFISDIHHICQCRNANPYGTQPAQEHTVNFCTIYNGEIKLNWLVVRIIWLQMRLVRNCALVLNMKTDTMTTKAVILRDTMQSCHIDSIRKTDRLNLCQFLEDMARTKKQADVRFTYNDPSVK